MSLQAEDGLCMSFAGTSTSGDQNPQRTALTFRQGFDPFSDNKYQIFLKTRLDTPTSPDLAGSFLAASPSNPHKSYQHFPERVGLSEEYRSPHAGKQ